MRWVEEQDVSVVSPLSSREEVREGDLVTYKYDSRAFSYGVVKRVEASVVVLDTGCEEVRVVDRDRGKIVVQYGEGDWGDLGYVCTKCPCCGDKVERGGAEDEGIREDDSGGVEGGVTQDTLGESRERKNQESRSENEEGEWV